MTLEISSNGRVGEWYAAGIDFSGGLGSSPIPANHYGGEGMMINMMGGAGPSDRYYDNLLEQHLRTQEDGCDTDEEESED